MSVVDEIFEVFKKRGADAYFGEPVSQQEHALQAAHLAALEDAPNTLIVAALLHDIGHLISGDAEDIADHGVDAHHESKGERWLQKWFPSEITGPISLHVAAKRYLCSTEQDYSAKLSPASLQSLELQGGPFDAEEVKLFEANPHYAAAILLRYWDDEAKIPGAQVPELEYYRNIIEAAALG